MALMSSAPLRRAARRRPGVRLLALAAAACLAAAAHASPDPDPDPTAKPVIDRAMIDRSGEQTVPDLLRREAGLFVTNTTTNPGSYNVEARGFSNGGGNGCNTL